MWARLVSTVLGVWLMAAPAALGYAGPARTNDHIVGPLIAGIAFVAVWEVARGLRWLAGVAAVWLLVAPWVLGYGELATANNLAVGAPLLALAFVRGRTRQRFGGGWPSLLCHPTQAPRASH